MSTVPLANEAQLQYQRNALAWFLRPLAMRMRRQMVPRFEIDVRYRITTFEPRFDERKRVGAPEELSVDVY